jgi:hypothetical protein
MILFDECILTARLDECILTARLGSALYEQQPNGLSTTTTELESEIWEGEADEGSSYCALHLDNFSAPFVSRMDSESTFIEYTDDDGPQAVWVGQFKEDLANFLVEPYICQNHQSPWNAVQQ